MARYVVESKGGSQRLVRYYERTASTKKTRVWPGAAFLIEALLLLMFILVSLAVIMGINARADNLSEDNLHLAQAIDMAGNCAEQFSANPVAAIDPTVEPLAVAGIEESADGGNITYKGELVAVRSIAAQQMPGGILYTATIQVWERSDVQSIVPYETATSVYSVNLTQDAINRDVEAVYTLETARYVSNTNNYFEAITEKARAEQAMQINELVNGEGKNQGVGQGADRGDAQADTQAAGQDANQADTQAAGQSGNQGDAQASGQGENQGVKS
jgi:hypothetical protein